LNKVLVANRGAIARRVIRACNELGLESVAVYSEADIGAPYLAEASQTYALAGHSATETYLNQERLLDVLKHSGAQGVHPGYGFLSESADFARAVQGAGKIFIGPAPEWLERMGDKVAARALMSQEGFPTFSGSDLITGIKQAKETAELIGYPVLVKPTGGGGGMGMERVEGPEALEHAIARSRTIATSAFASDGIYLEKWIEQPRHIEFQIIADNNGRSAHVFERECSIQRRNQKLIEESPAPGLPAETLLAVAEQSATVCTHLGYNNVGTLETLLSQDGVFGFLEMNTRIQVEHGVTEEVTGLDLVGLQIKLAQGENLPQSPQRSGFAIEARVYAEDAVTLLPSTGKLAVFRLPDMYGVRVETGFQEGQSVTPYYDALLAKVIAKGHTREIAIGRLSIALKAFAIEGVATNIPLLQRVLLDERFLDGKIDTGLLDSIRN